MSGMIPEDDGTGEIEEKFEHYSPKHPLPEEIREMKRDDTVCRYCGVSYLIHSEIKALENRLKQVETELEHYKGSEEREAKLREESNKLREAIADKEAVVNTLKSELKSGSEVSRRLSERNEQLESQLSASVKSCENYKVKCSLYHSNLPSILSEVKKQKSVIQVIRTALEERETSLRADVSNLVSCVRKKEQENRKYMQIKLAELERENADLSEQSKSSRVRWRENECRLEERCSQLERTVKDKTNELEKTVSSLRMLTLETEQYKDQLKSRTQELEDVTVQHRRSCQTHNDSIQKLQSELDSKISYLQETKKQLKNLQNQFQEQQLLEEEIQRRASFSINQTEELKDSLTRVNDDNEALKAEREIMITAHQNQIAELKESFKNKMYEAEKWPEKLEEALQKERIRHATEMKTLEEKLKENFILELQIEKQKHREMLQKYLTEYKEGEAKLKAQLGTLEGRLRSENSDLRKVLDETKTRAAETENKLRKEVENLKSIIKDLEERLAKAGTGSEEKVLLLKENLQNTKQQLEKCQEELSSSQQQSLTHKEEVLFLQETVRKECEERFELTEALSDAREQLLALKRPPGGYSSTNLPYNNGISKPPSRLDSSGVDRILTNQSVGNRTPVSQSVANRTTVGQSLANMTLASQSGVRLSSNLSGSRPSTNQSGGSITPVSQSVVSDGRMNFGRQSSMSSSEGGSLKTTNSSLGREMTHSSNINMEFEKESAKPAGKLKGRSVAENRKRIAAILGRK